jgi:hypothetical protein
MFRKVYFLIVLLLLVSTIVGCVSAPTKTSIPNAPTQTPAPKRELHIAADKQIEAFIQSGIVEYCGEKTGINTRITTMLSTDLKAANDAAGSKDNPDRTYQAFWGTSEPFVPYRPKYWPTIKAYTAIASASTERDQRLGWDRNGITAESLLSAMESGNAKVFTQNIASTSPAADIAVMLLTAKAKQTMLTQQGLDNLSTKDLAGFAKIAGAADSVDTFKQQVLNDLQGKREYDLFWGYDATFMQINESLKNLGLAPLRVYYLVDATTIASFPFIFTGGPEYANAAETYAACLGSSDVAKMAESQGYRVTEQGMLIPNPPAIFDVSTGIVTQSVIKVTDYPLAVVIANALDRFQYELKPQRVITIVQDHTGSMESNGGRQDLLGRNGNLGAYDYIYHQETSKKYGMQIGKYDVVHSFIFKNGECYFVGTATGDDSDSIKTLLEKSKKTGFGGSTAMYSCIRDGIENVIRNPDFDPEKKIYGVYVFTDGNSNSGINPLEFQDYWSGLTGQQKKIKVFGVGFGAVDLQEYQSDNDYPAIAKQWCGEIAYKNEPCSHNNTFVMLRLITGAQLIDGNNNLIEALRNLFGNY